MFSVPPFMTSASNDALRQAAAQVERQSSVELVVVVRPQSASYRHIDLSVGMTTAMLVLAFLLYSPWPFAWHFFLIYTFVTAIGMTMVSSKLPWLRRGLSKQSTMDREVLQAARAAFVSQGVHHTQYRTGVVLYVSLLERKAVLVADSGVELAIPKQPWTQFEDKITALLRAGGSAMELAKAIEDASEIFATYLPRPGEDKNELPDGVVE
jgi:putative membrane protein